MGQDTTLTGLIIKGLTLLPRVGKPWAGIRNPVGIDLASLVSGLISLILKDLKRT